jgi:hypothetical protein
MKRYAVTVVFTVVIILLYELIDLNFFTIDLTKRINDNLFTTFGKSLRFARGVVLCNMGKLNEEQVAVRIDSLLKLGPRIIGINVCHRDKPQMQAFQKFRDNKKVLLCECDDKSAGASGIIVEDGNIVTHFNTDNPNRFEIAISDSWGSLSKRNNLKERIYYRRPLDHYFQFELSDLNQVLPEVVSDNIVLVGYMGDYMVTDEMMYFQSARITPLNPNFGQDASPDMFDVQISANIISAIADEEFINEIGPFSRSFILFMLCLIAVSLITVIRTSWIALDIFIYLIVFLAVAMLGSFMIVYLFSEGYYLEMNELNVLLFIASGFAVWSNVRHAKQT